MQLLEFQWCNEGYWDSHQQKVSFIKLMIKQGLIFEYD